MKKLLILYLLAAANLSYAGTLHADSFGNVYDGNNPFQVGEINNSSGSDGIIYSDEFGNLYSGDSPFSFGRINDYSGNGGALHMDDFGRIYIGNSPFESTDAKNILNINK